MPTVKTAKNVFSKEENQQRINPWQKKKVHMSSLLVAGAIGYMIKIFACLGAYVLK
jgi:hypothetical protein